MTQKNDGWFMAVLLLLCFGTARVIAGWNNPKFTYCGNVLYTQKNASTQISLKLDLYFTEIYYNICNCFQLKIYVLCIGNKKKLNTNFGNSITLFCRNNSIQTVF